MIAADAGPRPAGFWQRSLAWTLDWLLLAPPLAWALASRLRQAWRDAAEWVMRLQDWLLDRLLRGQAADPLGLARALLADPMQGPAAQAQLAQLSLVVAQSLALAGAVAALYFVGFEASPWQATPGKRLLGLRVQPIDGGRVDGFRALARHVGGVLSWLTLNLGHALVAFRDDGRALHDLLAGTRVAASGPLPRWARWLLGGAAVALASLLLLAVARLLWMIGLLAGA